MTTTPGLQGVAPFKEPHSRVSHYTKPGAVTLLGFASSGAFHSPDPGLSRDSPSSALSLTSKRGERGALEFFCRGSGTARKERADPSAVSSLLSLSNLFDKGFVDGLFFSPDARSRIAAETFATSLTTNCLVYWASDWRAVSALTSLREVWRPSEVFSWLSLEARPAGLKPISPRVG